MNFAVFFLGFKKFSYYTFTVTLLSSAVIIFMFVSETLSFLSVDIVEQLYVDSTPAEQRVDVNFDITFPRLPCSGSNRSRLIFFFP